jgi:hypothetical protein
MTKSYVLQCLLMEDICIFLLKQIIFRCFLVYSFTHFVSNLHTKKYIDIYIAMIS